MAAVKKRPSAFALAMQEAQREAEEETPAQVEAPPAPAQTSAVQEPPAPQPAAPADVSVQEKRKAGRPKGVPKKKYVFYLPPARDASIEAIQKGLVKHADALVKDASEVTDLALKLLQFGLEDAESRGLFLALYERWREHGPR